MSSAATFESLRLRNYRLFFVGQTVSQCGTWMQTMAVNWLVLELSGRSGVAVGTAVALQYVPTLLLVVYAGTLADRFDKRKLLIIADVAMGSVAVLLFVLDVTGVVELWMLYVIVFVYGIAFAIDNPTRQSIVPELVPARDLPNAIGLNSASMQSARIIGPAIAGVTIVGVGTGACFGVNAVSYLFIIGALLMVRPAEMHRGAPIARAKGQIREGFRYMWHTAELRTTLLILVVVGTFAINSPVILPLMARNAFDGNADVYSWMTIAMGSGAFVGALVWAHRPRARGGVLLLAGLAYGATILVAAASPALSVFLGFLILVGAAQMWFLAACSTLVQLTAAPTMRGRVMAVYTLAVIGTTPIGGPIVGWLSEQLGPRWAYSLGGVATIASVLVFGRTLLHASRRRPGEESAPPATADEEVVFGVDGEVISATIK